MVYLYAILALTLLWLLVLTILLAKSLLHYKKLTQNVNGGSLLAIWEKNLEKQNQNEKVTEELNLKLNTLIKKSTKHFQKIGVVRYNPFEEAGGNQSFVISLLDGNGDGVVLSSLHGRDQTRVYAKPVKGFEPDGFDFSQEEKNAVHIAKDSER